MKPRMCSMHICWPQLCPLGGVVESVLQRCSRWSNRFNLLSKLEYIAHIARQSSALPFGVGKPAVLCIGPSGTWMGSPHESLVKHTMNHSMACFPLLPSRLEKDRKGDPQFWYTLIRTTSWLVSLLIPISADRVDLLVCNANGISDQIATGYPWVDGVSSSSCCGETVAIVPLVWVGSACSPLCDWVWQLIAGGWICSTWYRYRCLVQCDVKSLFYNVVLYWKSLHSELGS